MVVVIMMFVAIIATGPVVQRAEDMVVVRQEHQAGAPVLPGDVLVAVNGISTQRLSVAEVSGCFYMDI